MLLLCPRLTQPDNHGVCVTSLVMQRTKITATCVPGSNRFAVRTGSSRPVSTDVAGNNTHGRLKRKWLPHHISSSGNHASYRTDCRCCWWITSHDLDRTTHQRGRIMKLQTRWCQSQSRMPPPQRSLVELASAQLHRAPNDLRVTSEATKSYLQNTGQRLFRL